MGVCKLIHIMAIYSNFEREIFYHKSFFYICNIKSNTMIRAIVYIAAFLSLLLFSFLSLFKGIQQSKDEYLSEIHTALSESIHKEGDIRFHEHSLTCRNEEKGKPDTIYIEAEKEKEPLTFSDRYNALSPAEKERNRNYSLLAEAIPMNLSILDSLFCAITAEKGMEGFNHVIRYEEKGGEIRVVGDPLGLDQSKTISVQVVLGVNDEMTITLQAEILTLTLIKRIPPTSSTWIFFSLSLLVGLIWILDSLLRKRKAKREAVSNSEYGWLDDSIVELDKKIREVSNKRDELMQQVQEIDIEMDGGIEEGAMISKLTTIKKEINALEKKQENILRERYKTIKKGKFLYDILADRIFFNNNPLNIGGISYQIMVAILKSDQDCFTLEDLRNLVWGKQVVSDDAIRKQVSYLNQAISSTGYRLTSIRNKGYSLMKANSNG